MTPLPDLTGRAATVGMFDGVHLGHQLVIRQLTELAQQTDIESMVFTFDCHPLQVIAPEKAPKLLTTVSRRADLIVNAGADYVVVLPFAEIRHLSSAEFLSYLHDHYNVELLLVGFNHHFGNGRKGTFDDYQRQGQQCGVCVLHCDEYESTDAAAPMSSSTIRRLIGDGRIEAARQMLGHAFEISGKVVHGRRMGHQLGFPTANLLPFQSCQLLPGYGAYAAWAYTQDGDRLPAMVNIGDNPTLGPDNDTTVEAHILDYMGELYGKVLTLDIVARLREEHRFESLQQLMQQLRSDLTQTRSLLGL